VRVDTALQAGDEISLHYDPLIAKLITWGRNREEAIARMRGALDEFLIAGVHTTIDFHREILSEPAFRSGRLDIGFLDRVLPGIADRLREIGPDGEIAAIAAAIAASEEATKCAHVARSTGVDPWTMAGRRAMIESRFNRTPRT